MEKENNNKNNKMKNQKFVFLTTLLIIIILLVIYFSFSGTYLTGQIYIDSIPKQPMNNIKGIEEDPIAYVYTTDETYGNYIYLMNQFPIKDEIGRSLEGQYRTFDFQIKYNGKTTGVDYTITLEKMDGTTLSDDWIKIYLEEEGRAINNCIRPSGRVKTYNEFNKYNGKNNEIVLYKSKVTESDIKAGYRSFRFRMWVSEDVVVNNGIYESNSFIARVNVHAIGSF